MTMNNSQLYTVDEFLNEFKDGIINSVTFPGWKCHQLYLILNNIYGEQCENEATTESKVSYPQNIMDIIVGAKLYDINTIPNLEENLNKAYDTLLPREKSFIIKRYKELMSYKELSDKYKCSGELCRQVIQKALRKLRHPSRLRIILGTKDIIHEIDELKRLANHYKEVIESCKKIEHAHDERIEELKRQEKSISSSFLSRNINELEFSTRSYNALNRGVAWFYFERDHELKKEITVEDVIGLTIPELKNIKNLGAKSFKEISTKIHSFGLKFKDEDKIIEEEDDDDDYYNDPYKFYDDTDEFYKDDAEE